MRKSPTFFDWADAARLAAEGKTAIETAAILNCNADNLRAAGRKRGIVWKAAPKGWANRTAKVAGALAERRVPIKRLPPRIPRSAGFVDRANLSPGTLAALNRPFTITRPVMQAIREMLA